MQNLIPNHSIQFIAARQDTPAAPLSMILLPAPSTPEPGLPGKEAGDVNLIQANSGMHVQVSLGSPAKITLDTYRSAGGLSARWLRKNGVTAIDLDAGPFAAAVESKNLLAFIEGVFLGSYEFSRHKTGANEKPLITINLRNTPPDFENQLQTTASLTSAVALAREWTHEPANVINPVTLAEYIQAITAGLPLKVTVFDDQHLAKMGAGGLMEVGKGSLTGPRLIVIEYPGQGTAQPPVALVGKAITFDTGGYSLKSVEGIQGMKSDKAGGVTTAAVLWAAAVLKIKTPLIGVICAAENMISGNSYRPDDIITTLSGKTVEIVTTDAEGRLVLADGLTYVQRHFKPRAIIDMATLTGGVVTALGRVRAGLFSNQDELANALLAAGEKTHERLWRLPLDEDYVKNIKGDDADLKNSGGREGHPIYGGVFLQQFVSADIPWAHLDIAGTADSPKDLPYSPKGATGFGVRLLLDYLQNL